MQDFLDESLRKLRKIRIRKRRLIAILLVLSLIVSLDVFWALRQPGLTLAGDASCKIVEHTHDETCQNPCPLTEHVHSISCYSHESEDVETQLDWQGMFENYPYTGDLQKDLVGIARTQAGYQESTLNFQVGDDGVRRGYTRYGAWYGVPYNDWSAIFVSFCLHYAGADPKEYPRNIGADAMALQWKKLNKFAEAGQHTPTAGDLVFFTDNTVGIVTDVLQATFCVIRGDAENAVRSSVMFLGDASISGWGLIQGVSQPPPDTEQEDPLDISGGPAIFIYEGEEPVQRKMARYAISRSVEETEELTAYLKEYGGSYFFTLLDLDNVELPKDATGNYIAVANKDYKLTLTVNSPNGFHPGTYKYQIPNGLMVNGGEGTFVLKDGTDVGTWVVTDTGLITLEFNENINSRTQITISAALGIHFPQQEDPIDFDGKISVKVEPPVQQTEPTTMSKYGNPGELGNGARPDPSKIYWTIEIHGNKNSVITENILADRILDGQWSKIHRFTETDMADGLTITANSPDGGWHTWTVTADDPHLIWTETGWSYKMPSTATCQGCGEIELGDNGWIYYVKYTSTPERVDTFGTYGYENEATIDGAYAYAWENFTHGQAIGVVTKTGTFISDAADGGFLWEVQATIPGRAEGKRAEYSWAISDEMRLLDADGAMEADVYNDINLATVYTVYNGTTIQVPRIQDATDADMFAWDNAWTSDDGSTRTINLLMRCQCTAETCHWGNCGEYYYHDDAGKEAVTREFCQCWTQTQEMTFTLVYKTTDLSTLEVYGPLDYKVSNRARLYYMTDSTNSVEVSNDIATVTIPNLFEKKLTHDFDGYVANYKITVNEAGLVLTDDVPLYIRDVMSDTLAYIGGSLMITTEDENGNITLLHEGADYTVTYDGTGKQTDSAGNKAHVLDIVILHPQPVLYTLDYDATLIMPEQVTSGIRYSNYAEITLWGEKIQDSAVEKVYANINIAATSYKVEMIKTSALTGKPLGGATFGLFNAHHDGLIATGVTDALGRLDFETNVIQGIILLDHTLYYLQELQAPEGYTLDDTKYWFCFCNKTSDTCDRCDEVLAGLQAVRIPFEQIGNIRINNEPMDYDLPGTGGPGIYPLILVSVMFIVTPLVYGFIRRRKRERRGVG